MSEEQEHQLPLYASIGGLIIDDIIYQDGRQVTNVLGGGGVFAIIGMLCQVPLFPKHNWKY